MAILDELLDRGPHCVITTHHGSLKHYGFTKAAAANASMEFDMKSLRPTYRIVPGVPGSSHAIDVAAHMGLLRTVTRAARTYLQGDEYDTGRIIRSLTDREQELHNERETLREQNREVEKRNREIDRERKELDRREGELRAGRLRDLESWASEARSELENLVRAVREGELTREKTLRVKDFVRKTTEELTDLRAAGGAAGDSDPAQPQAPASFDPGASVRMRRGGKTGLLVRRSKGKRWQVQVGNLKLDVDESDLELIDRPREERPVISVSGISAHASIELDLRGKRLEEAIDELERQIDQAVVSGMNRFGVIHGTGEGVLQKGVHDYLRRSEHVRRFEFARPEDGGYGKTIVELA